MEQNSIVINDSFLNKLAERDNLFAEKISTIKKDFISFLRTLPNYINMLQSKLSEGDIYVAKISDEVISGLKNGNYEKILKNKTHLWNGSIRNKFGPKTIVEQADFQKIKF